MKTKITISIFLICLGFNFVHSQFTTNKPDLRLCGTAPNYYQDYYNCTSNNYTLDDVFLSLTDVNGVPLNNTTCTPGVPETMYVMLNYTSNSNSNINHARMFADLIIDGVVTPLNVHLGTVAPGAGQRLLYGPFTWVCGQEMILDRILIVWKTNGNNTELVPYTCSTYNRSQCEFPTTVIITAPLAVQFEYSGCTNGGISTINFDSTTNGGTPPYSYAWDFDSNGTTDSTLENPTFNYNNSSSNTASLTVTDAMGLTNTFSVPIVYPSEVIVNANVQGLTCVPGSTASIDLTISGGTAPYTVLWNTGATSQDLSNLGIGTYSATITDALGCIKNYSTTISAIVCCEFLVTCPTFSPISLQCYDLLPQATSLTELEFEALGNGDGIIGNNPCGVIQITASNSAYLGCNTQVTRTYTITEYLDANDNGIRDAGENTILNVVTCSQIFTINDTTDPTITTQAANLEVQCDGSGNTAQLNAWLASNGGAVASDVCSNVTWTNNFASVSDTCGATGSATVTFTATDDCGNASTTSATFTIIDDTDPIFTSELPQDISVSCDAIPNPANMSGSDNCGEVTITVLDTIDREESQCEGEYIISRTWTITDSCNNSSSYTQTITVFDNTPPILTTPLDAQISVLCSEIPEIPQLVFTDNCSGIQDVVYNETSTIISIYAYVIVREWVVSDNCGNEASFTQTINVSVEEPFDAIPFAICIEENPIDLFTILDDSIPTTGTWQEVTNSGGLTGSIFNPSNVALGYYTLQYIVELEDNACPMIYEIYLNVNDDCVVLPACDITVYNAVSPNDDSSNDFFFIDGLECYPNNTVEIYNRWGILVYDERGYDNNLKSFKGISEGKNTINKNELLPDGTYFYILKYTDEENKNHDRSGYLYLNR